MDRPYVICHMLSSLDGRISGAFMRCESTGQAREGLVDELSIVLFPTIEGDRRAASLAEYTGKSAPQTPVAFSLISAQPLGDALWLRYRRRGEEKESFKR